MYYITKRDSESGKRFLHLYENIKNVNKASKDEAGIHGCSEYYTHRWALAGGIEAVILPNGTENPALRLSKTFGKNNVYVPNLKNKAGKELAKKWESLPVVHKKEANQIVNYKETIFGNIGYDFNNKEYVGFIVDEKWGVVVPEDCEEVTTTKFKELFKKDEPKENTAKSDT